MSSKQDYYKLIVDEYNIRLQSWGDSNSWGMTECKMLESLIYGASKVRIDAATLKRFFQQRTSTPQIATSNALCVFLGYSGYTDFVMKKTSLEQKNGQVETETKANDTLDDVTLEVLPDENDVPKIKNETPDAVDNRPKKKYLGKYTYLLVASIILTVLLLNWDTIRQAYKKHLINQIIFETSITKGGTPLTVKFEYTIPKQLKDGIELFFVEANGDVVQRKPEKSNGETYMTYIHPGKGFCLLKYGNQIIKTVNIETRLPGWSVFVRNDKIDFFEMVPFENVVKKESYITLPVGCISPKAVTDMLFVSYAYYADSIVDGDNFICEARLRNSPENQGIPCYDVMMYAYSANLDLLHCFALNKDCYSYLKFISGENRMMGQDYDLRQINFNPSEWNVMRIEVLNKHTTFYLNKKVVVKMDYQKSVGAINEIVLRFKGCGAVDYLKIMKPDGEVVYQSDFND